MNTFLRLSRGSRHDPAIDDWLSSRPDGLGQLARFWFERMRQMGDDVLALMHDGCPVACVEDAPFGYVNAFRDHVNVGFFQGAALLDGARLLQGAGKRMRHVKLKPGQVIPVVALSGLVEAAYQDIHLRLRS